MRCKHIKKINIKFLKNKKLIILICILLLVITSSTFGKYIYDGLQNFYFQTKKFYFNSDKLKDKTATYSLDNWSGAGEYTININMNSIKNNLLKAETDISYNITYQCPSTVTCQITKTSGVIYGSVNKDSFNIVVTPNTTFHDGDTILIYVSATSTSPYEKTISARFILKVGKIGLSYEITDEEKSPYLEFRITNTIDDGNSYINGYTFKMEAISSQMVRFYKVNTSNNYTYPLVNETSVINFESR